MISVLLPSRDRDWQMVDAADSLLYMADSFDDVEILIAADPDDEGTIDTARGCDFRLWIAPERYGYANLSAYWNHLAMMASGDWLLLWNDDARMLTSGWDQIIKSQPPAVLWAYTRGDDAGNYFPVWPASWTRLLGRICPIPGPHVDTYIQAVGKHLDRIRRIPVELDHTRPDFTGTVPADDTYAEGRMLLGRYGMVPGWDTLDLPHQAAEDAARIRDAGLL